MGLDFRNITFIRSFVILNSNFFDIENRSVSYTLNKAITDGETGLYLKQNPIIFLPTEGADTIYVILLMFSNYGFLTEDRTKFLFLDQEKVSNEFIDFLSKRFEGSKFSFITFEEYFSQRAPKELKLKKTRSQGRLSTIFQKINELKYYNFSQGIFFCSFLNDDCLDEYIRLFRQKKLNDRFPQPALLDSSSEISSDNVVDLPDINSSSNIILEELINVKQTLNLILAELKNLNPNFVIPKKEIEQFNLDDDKISQDSELNSQTLIKNDSTKISDKSKDMSNLETVLVSELKEQCQISLNNQNYLTEYARLQKIYTSTGKSSLQTTICGPALKIIWQKQNNHTKAFAILKKMELDVGNNVNTRNFSEKAFKSTIVKNLAYRDLRQEFEREQNL